MIKKMYLVKYGMCFIIYIFITSCTTHFYQPKFYAKDGQAFAEPNLASDRDKALERIENYRKKIQFLSDRDFINLASLLSVTLSYQDFKKFRDTNFIPFNMQEGKGSITYYEQVLKDFLANQENKENKSIVMNLYSNSNLCLKEDIGLFKTAKDLRELMEFYSHLSHRYNKFSDLHSIEQLGQKYKEEHFIYSRIRDYNLLSKKHEYLFSHSYGLKDMSNGIITNKTRYFIIHEFLSIDEDLFDEVFAKNIQCYYQYEQEIKKIYKY